MRGEIRIIPGTQGGFCLVDHNDAAWVYLTLDALAEHLRALFSVISLDVLSMSDDDAVKWFTEASAERRLTLLAWVRVNKPDEYQRLSGFAKNTGESPKGPDLAA